jgi:hypothetical protein
LNHGDTDYMWRWLFCVGIVVLCVNACFLHVCLRLAEASIAEDTERKSLFGRKLARPLQFAAICVIMSWWVTILVILSPRLPFWPLPIIFVVAAAATALCYRRDWLTRAYTCLPSPIAAFSPAGIRPEHPASSAPTTDGRHCSLGSRPSPRPSLPPELHEAR